MRIASSLLMSAALLTTPPVFAAAGTEGAVFTTVEGSHGCPVDLSAQYGGATGSIVATRRGEAAQRPPQRHAVEVTLRNNSGRAIAGASGTLHGLPAKLQLLPASGSGGRDVQKSFQLQVPIALEGTGSSVLSMDHVSTVQWVDLDLITFADGSVWRSSEGARCRAVPDPLMLLSSK